MENHDVPRVTARSIPYGEERIAMYEAIKAGEKAAKPAAKAKPSAKPAKAVKPSASGDDIAILTAIATEAAVAAVQSYLAAKG